LTNLLHKNESKGLDHTLPYLDAGMWKLTNQKFSPNALMKGTNARGATLPTYVIVQFFQISYI
jgi:hypothetical protein